MSLKEGNNQRPPRNPGWSCFSRCFSGSTMHYEDGEPISSVRSKKKKKKSKAIPVDTAGPTGRQEQEEERLHKKRGKIRPRRKPKQQALEDAELNSSTQSETPAAISPKYDTRRRQVSATIVAEPVVSVTTTTTITRLPTAAAPAPAARPDGHLEPVVGLSVLVATLAAMLLCGRVCAVFCLCACLYLVPLFLTTAAEMKRRKKSIDVDMNSEEYKKKVILEGLLERNRRRGSGSNVVVPASPTARV